MKDAWIAPSCDYCGQTAATLLFQGQDWMHGLPGTFSLVQCHHCGLIRQSPRLTWEALQRYYPEDYCPYQVTIEQERAIPRRLDRRYGMWKRVQLVRRVQPEGRLLDVGCGTGIFLAEAARCRCWELMGVEPHAAAARYAAQTLAVPVLNQRFDQVDLAEGTFHVITLWNVLEHLEHPVQDLKRAYRLLQPGGWLIFSIPNVDGLARRLFGPYWMGWDLPRHLYLFPFATLRQILGEIGFQNIQRRCVAGSHASLELSLRFWLRAHHGENRWTESLLRLYRSLPMRLLLGPLFWLADRLHQCSLITVLCQKPAHD